MPCSTISRPSGRSRLGQCSSYALPSEVNVSCLSLKAELRWFTKAIYNGQDVFAWLPTGYAKSLRFSAVCELIKLFLFSLSIVNYCLIFCLEEVAVLVQQLSL